MIKIMEEKKYELTNETITLGVSTLYRIRALKDFGNVKKGDLGGYIEFEYNLSHRDNCWIYDNAVVCDHAQIRDNAQVHDEAHIHNSAQISCGAVISGNADIYEHAMVWGSAKVYGNASVCGYTEVYEHAEVFEDANLHNEVFVFGNAKVYGEAEISDSACILGKAKVYGDIFVCDHAIIDSDAVLSKSGDYIPFLNIFLKGCSLTWTRSNNMWYYDGRTLTSEELMEAVYDISKEMINYTQSCIDFVKNYKPNN